MVLSNRFTSTSFWNCSFRDTHLLASPNSRAWGEGWGACPWAQCRRASHGVTRFPLSVSPKGQRPEPPIFTSEHKQASVRLGSRPRLWAQHGVRTPALSDRPSPGTSAPKQLPAAVCPRLCGSVGSGTGPRCRQLCQAPCCLPPQGPCPRPREPAPDAAPPAQEATGSAHDQHVPSRPLEEGSRGGGTQQVGPGARPRLEDTRYLSSAPGSTWCPGSRSA